ncbi:MAG: hypothetical protein A2821_03400 [Candidatus Magasanikbacteria bacterium RIFCSPHIGHO2_01_FULL_41_23]|uniref:Uncharacterized protein n=1 Tax=Candidatus Magasanikbacteria bacterium RIFCSPLOWO2_01_FULL_40_15 TaxID=1798686 RepID=A0A1F6N3S2_9BACT|nr:MAG: hypothetical protein A2821_03400 [Candidatus Magasanikbacteria bacterium RIFCSPHIGHO2_01_FULL_41_23]OGH76706.1 MAG: hypothetical protein A3F22_03885 [Candidatus Magasanikbacteria bacterium RIFCSPHIGHO2_12_FULL_41_16]OGH78646.1 MAG: hypothetical protein A2983_04785 [Candidatus Magasanikbacteria bacterium RIFCSPLOWO2_01_FULL_40_15]
MAVRPHFELSVQKRDSNVAGFLCMEESNRLHSDSIGTLGSPVGDFGRIVPNEVPWILLIYTDSAEVILGVDVLLERFADQKVVDLLGRWEIEKFPDRHQENQTKKKEAQGESSIPR